MRELKPFARNRSLAEEREPGSAIISSTPANSLTRTPTISSMASGSSSFGTAPFAGAGARRGDLEDFGFDSYRRILERRIHSNRMEMRYAASI